MEYILENEQLKVTVTTWGAQVKSVVRKKDGAEHIWQGDKSLWGFHAPILFPHCGRLVEDKLEAKGKIYESGVHGFVRHLEHAFVEQTGNSVVLELCSSPETLARFPYEFRLVSAFCLEGDTLHHKLTVENRDGDKLRFGIGYHPGFAVPFDGEHTAKDYELRFSGEESPLCVNTRPYGLVHGDYYRLGENVRSLPVCEELFATDGHCMTQLKSETLGIYEKDSGRAVVCRIKDFPYVLLWSKPGEPRFVCIEPWHSLPSEEGASIRWEEKSAAAELRPGETWSCTLSTSFVG